MFGLWPLKLSDGKPLWKQENAHVQAFTATPLLCDHKFLLLAPFDKGGDKGRLYEVDFGQAPHAAHLLWENPDLICPASTPVCQNGFIYGYFGAAVLEKGAIGKPVFGCVELKTGKMLWKTEPQNIRGSLITADGLLLVRADLELWLVEPNSEKLSVKGKVKVEATSNCGWVMPALAYGRLFVRTDTEVICFQVAEHLASRAEVEQSRR